MAGLLGQLGAKVRVGDGDELSRALLRRFAAQLGHAVLGDHDVDVAARWIGHIEHTRHDRFRGVLRAHAEVSPPVVARIVDAVGVEVGGDAAIYFDPENVDEIAAAIDRLLSDSELRAKLAAAGPARASEFSWRRAAELTTGVYDEVLSSSKRS